MVHRQRNPPRPGLTNETCPRSKPDRFGSRIRQRGRDRVGEDSRVRVEGSGHQIELGNKYLIQTERRAEKDQPVDGKRREQFPGSQFATAADSHECGVELVIAGEWDRQPDFVAGHTVAIDKAIPKTRPRPGFSRDVVSLRRGDENPAWFGVTSQR